MEKLMPLELLSNIRGARPSPDVERLFMIIKDALPGNNIADHDEINGDGYVPLEDLRDDEVIESSSTEKEIIKENFPERKNEFLVVSKVIEEL
jgi:Asp-tRNA(Asn)/Glu-tRNA(Gln) amidotransferase C subunit